MTNEEAIDVLEQRKTCMECVANCTCEECDEAFDLAIKALEQTDTLDKIRAEIDRQQKWLLQAGYTAYNVDIAFDAIKAVVVESEGRKWPE